MLTEIKISPGELERLNYERYNYPCPLVQKRFHAIYIKAVTGFSNEEVGRIVGAHRNSISGWVQVYGQQGFDALCRVNYGSNKSLLEGNAASIKELFIKEPPRGIAEAGLRIKGMTDIGRGPTRIRAFMKRHGFRCLKTGHIPAKVNTTEQKNWVEETLKPAIKAAQEGGVHLLFMDAAHFILQPFLCHLWCMARVFILVAA